MASMALGMVCLALLGGCAAIPDVGKDVAAFNLPDKWSSPNPGSGPQGDGVDGKEVAANEFKLSDKDFWKVFGDEDLDRLVELALRNNKSVRIATINLQKLMLSRASSGMNFAPVLSGSGGGSKSFDPVKGTKWNGSLNISYQADLFGSIASGYKGTDIALNGGEADARNVYLALVSQVANAYWGVLALNEKVDLAKSQLDASNKISRMMESRLKAGVISEGDYLLALKGRDDVESAAMDIVAKRDAALRQLAILLGLSPEKGKDLVPMDKKLPERDLPAIMESSPATVLATRPDVASSLSTLLGDVNGVKASIRAFFPVINLSYSISDTSSELKDLFDATSTAGGIGLLFPFLDFPRKALKLRVSRLAYDADLLNYRDVLHKALGEVEDARESYFNLERKKAFLVKDLQSSKKLAKVYESRYENGADSLQNMLERRDNVLKAEIALLDNRVARYSNFLERYLAIGGNPNDELMAQWILAANRGALGNPDVPKKSISHGSKSEERVGEEFWWLADHVKKDGVDVSPVKAGK